jgi:hypothetical protein
MPDHALRDDGFKKYLPLSRVLGMGRLFKTGTSQKTCQIITIVQSFREKKHRITSDSRSYFPRQLNIKADFEKNVSV